MCSPCRGWILQIKALYQQIQQLQPEIEVITIEDDPEEEVQQEPEVIWID